MKGVISVDVHDLITPREALKILTWVSPSGLYHGSLGTKELTRFKVRRATLYSRQECEALRDSIIRTAERKMRIPAKAAVARRRPTVTELV